MLNQPGKETKRIKLPGYSHRASNIDGPMGTQASIIVTTPEKAWYASPRGTRERPRIDWVTLASVKEEVALLAAAAYRLAALETEVADTGPVYVVTVEHDGNTYKRRYDQNSLMLLAAERPGERGGKEWVYYSDYREVDGLKVPHSLRSEGRLVMRSGGGNPEEHTIEIKSILDKVAFNVPVKDELFSEK